MATGQRGASDAGRRISPHCRRWAFFPVLNCRLDALGYPRCRASLSMDAPSIYPVASLHLPGSLPTRQSDGIQGRVAGIVSHLAGPDAAGAVHVRRRRSPPPAMPSQPRWSPPDPQQPGPCPAGTPPTTTPTVDRGWLRRHPPRAVAVVASWRRPGVPEPPPSSPRRQPTAPAAALLLGPKADRPRRTHDRPVCPFAVPYGRPGQLRPGPGVRFPQFRNARSGHWFTPRSVFLPKSDAILTNPSD